MNYYLISKLCYLIATILLFYLLLSALDKRQGRYKTNELIIETQPMKEEKDIF